MSIYFAIRNRRPSTKIIFLFTGNYIADYLHYRMKRDTQDSNEVASESGYFKMKIDSAEKLVEPEIPADYKHAFHGGER